MQLHIHHLRHLQDDQCEVSDLNFHFQILNAESANEQSKSQHIRQHVESKGSQSRRVDRLDI